MPKSRLSAPEPESPPARPALAEDLPCFLLLEREVETRASPTNVGGAARQGRRRGRGGAWHSAAVSALWPADAAPGQAASLLAGSLRAPPVAILETENEPVLKDIVTCWIVAHSDRMLRAEGQRDLTGAGPMTQRRRAAAIRQALRRTGWR